MSDTPSYRLKPSDKSKIQGFEDIHQPEPEQELAPFSASSAEQEDPNSKKLKAVRSLAQDVLDKIDRLSQQVDNRCDRFSITSADEKGSPLFQAMVRVFGERTTTVTYDHYKRALGLREQLAEEDRKVLRSK